MAMDIATEARMLAKSVTDQVEVRRLAEGTYATRSAKTPAGLSYTTTATSCTCPGYMSHQRCKHVAHVRQIVCAIAPDLSPVIDQMIAELWTGRPDMVPPAAETKRCPDCDGDGYRRVYGRTGYLNDWTTAPCHTCQSTGRVAVQS